MERSDSRLHAVIHAALLYDIGKVFCRADLGKSFVEAGRSAVNQLYSGREAPETVLDAIQWQAHPHDEPTPETWLIFEAGNIAAGFTRRTDATTEEGDPQSAVIPLRSIFSLLGAGAEKGDPLSYPLKLLGDEAPGQAVTPVYPSSEAKASPEQYDIIAQLWEKEVQEHRDVLLSRPNALLTLMESLFSYIPSDTPDISLYEHLRLTAALASCMYLYAVQDHGGDFQTPASWGAVDETQFLLVGGDISGIQKFIYNVYGESVLKSLRARSFYLEILSEHLIDELLELAGGDFGPLSRANLIYNGGAHFYLLLPNTKHVKGVLEQFSQDVNHWLWEQFRGTLFLSLGAEPCSAQDFMASDSGEEGEPQSRMGRKWQALTELLGTQKARKFATLPEDEFRSVFEPTETLRASEECAITKMDHDLVLFSMGPDQEKKACNRLSAMLWRMGQCLPRTDALWIQRDANPDLFRQCFDAPEQNRKTSPHVPLPDLVHPGRSCYLVPLQYLNDSGQLRPEDEERIRNTRGRFYSLNRWTLSQHLHTTICVGQYYWNKPGKDEKIMPEFDDLKDASTGIQKLGILRADVDDLGTLFTEKLKPNVNTLGRTAMLSKQLSLFFKLHLNAICEGHLGLDDTDPPFRVPETASGQTQQRPVVIVYSGGDDLFIAGAWNHIIELAVDIRKCFQRFTGGKLTLSAGVQVFDPHTPIAQMAPLTEMAEKKAKARINSTSAPHAKDALCLFPNPEALQSKTDQEHRDVYAWDDLDGISRLLRCLLTSDSPARQPKSWLPSGQVHHLYQLADLWSRKGYMSLPRLTYALERLEERMEPKNTQYAEQYRQLKAFLYDSAWLDEKHEAFRNVNIRDYKTLFTWLSYLTREEAVEEKETVS